MFFCLMACSTPCHLGTDGSTLTQYSLSLESDATYIAVVNITNATLFGQWAITLTFQGPYSIHIVGNSELFIISELVATNPSGRDGINDFKPLIGKVFLYKSYIWTLLCVGVLISVELTVMGNKSPVTIDTVNFVNSRGVIQPASDLTRTNNNSYVSLFMPPREEFQIQVVGIDDSRYNFSYISIEPTTISLTFGE